MPMNDPRYLQERASEVGRDVMAELPELPVKLTFEAYVGRRPVLTVTATTATGTQSSRDFDFLPLDKLHTLRLTNTIVRIFRERYAPEDEMPTPGAASL